MTQITNNPIPKLRKAPQPPLSHPGATPDSDRARKPSLAEPPATGQELASRGWAISESRPEYLARLSKRTKMTRSSNGIMTFVRDSTNRG
jgi:hypothetical protein